jgi:hypothetical protein
MDGKSRKEIIQSWFNAVVQEGERGRGHELHVFQIDKSWELESTWISAALESFDIARRIRDDHQSDTHWTVVMGLFLTSESFPLGVTFHNLSEMEQAFSEVAPALFLWPAGDEFWVRVKASKDYKERSMVKKLKAENFFEEKHKIHECIYLEHIWGDLEEYLRVVYLAG